MAKTINEVELSSELADRELRKIWNKENGCIDREEDGTIYYTDKAQDLFNELYDKFYDIILSTSDEE